MPLSAQFPFMFNPNIQRLQQLQINGSINRFLSQQRMINISMSVPFWGDYTRKILGDAGVFNEARE
jgi:hypothetical protein